MQHENEQTQTITLQTEALGTIRGDVISFQVACLYMQVLPAVIHTLYATLKYLRSCHVCVLTA